MNCSVSDHLIRLRENDKTVNKNVMFILRLNNSTAKLKKEKKKERKIIDIYIFL